jgi:signal transduction histidine kinase
LIDKIGKHATRAGDVLQSLRARIKIREVLVRVADRGPGVAPDEVDRIFAPFYSTRGSGLGIGLSLSRATVEATVVPNMGAGSVFRFTLPAANEDD